MTLDINQGSHFSVWLRVSLPRTGLLTDFPKLINHHQNAKPAQV